MSRDSKDLIVGLDIGTSKVAALVADGLRDRRGAGGDRAATLPAGGRGDGAAAHADG